MLDLKLDLPRREFDIKVKLNVAAGTTYCLYGPSGTGKSSILSVIAGFDRSYRSAHMALGATTYIDTASHPAEAVPTWQRGFGYMEQSAHLFPHLSVRDNIAYGVTDANSKEWLNTLIERLDVTPFLAAKPGKLSGGQKQRVALARALAIHPRLLLLDEPFSALDWHARLTLQQAIKEWQRKLGFTVILVTHQLTEAQRLADRIGLIDAGRIIQEGSPGELFACPNSQRAAQMLGYTHFLPANPQLLFGVHPDCAVPGAQPELGIVVQGEVLAQYEHAGRRRISLRLPQYNAECIEVNLPGLASADVGTTLALTFVKPPYFAA